MGNEQPKKIGKVTKMQIVIACKKSRIHLQMMRDRKNNQVIKAEKQLVKKIKSNSRNKTEEILLAERIINGLKYTMACNYLMSYASNLQQQANYIAQNIHNPAKLQPFLEYIYSLIFASQVMGLSSLKQFQQAMKALNDPVTLMNNVNNEIKICLSPQPTSEEMNTYFLEMSQRNAITLEEINVVGHKFSQNFGQPLQPSFSQIQKKLAQEFKKTIENGNNQGGMGSNQVSSNPYNNGSFNTNQGFNQNHGNFNQTPGYNGPNIPYGGFNTPQQQQYPPPQTQDSNPYGIRDSYRPPTNNNFGPSTIDPKLMQPINKIQQIPKYTQSRISIKSIADIDYYPDTELDYNPNHIDPDFNALCERIKIGL